MGKYHLRKELMKCGSNHIWSYTRNHATLAFANKMIHANGSKTEKMLWETVSGIVCIRVIRSIRRTTNAQRWPVWRPFSWWLRPAAAGAPPPVWASPSAARCAEGIMRESLIDYMLWALINEGSISYFPAWSQLAWPPSSHLLVQCPCRPRRSSIRPCWRPRRWLSRGDTAGCARDALRSGPAAGGRKAPQVGPMGQAKLRLPR